MSYTASTPPGAASSMASTIPSPRGSTTSAPKPRTSSSSSDFASAKTRSPRCFAIPITYDASSPAPPVTASVWPSVSPSGSRPLSAVTAFMGSVEACSRVAPSGIATTEPAGATSSSVCAPPPGRHGTTIAITSSPTVRPLAPVPDRLDDPGAVPPDNPGGRHSLYASLAGRNVGWVHRGSFHREPDLARPRASRSRARSRSRPRARLAARSPPLAPPSQPLPQLGDASRREVRTTLLRHTAQVECAADPASGRARSWSRRDARARRRGTRRLRSRPSPARGRRVAPRPRAPPHATACRRRGAGRRSPSRSRPSASSLG